MNPYYQDALVTLYNGNSAEIIPTLGRVGLTITDPPYGNNTDYADHDDSVENLRGLIESVIVPSIEMSDRALITCGAANIAMYPKPKWTLAWITPAGAGSGPWGFCCWQPILAYGTDPYLAAGMGRRPDILQITETAESNGHPCPKPLGVWEKIIARGSVTADDLLFDPFCGSGTTLVAAKAMGYKAIGIELSEKYCEISAKRLGQGSLFEQLTTQLSGTNL